jgi:SAM-dependent methyltransferase
MYESVDTYVRALPVESHDAVEISGHFYGDYPWRSYEHWDYPQFDLCNPSPMARSFDIVICDQVLEHVIDPITAVRTLYDLCRPGGHVVVGVPFLVRVHRAPGDYWRFTPDGLRILLERAGFAVSFVEGWGNRRCVKANFLVWARKPRWLPDVNEPEFPVNVWAFARRPRETA